MARDFESTRRRLELVAELRDDKDLRRRDELDDGRPHFLRLQMVIPADEPGDVQRRLRPDLDPVAGFYIEEALGLRLRVAEQA